MWSPADASKPLSLSQHGSPHGSPDERENGPCYRSKRRYRQSDSVGQIRRAASLQARQAARSTTRMEDIVERGYVVIGSPKGRRAIDRAGATDLNVGHLMLLMQFGNMNKDLAAYTIPGCSPTAYCQSSAAFYPNGRTNGGRNRCPARSAPRSRPSRRPCPRIAPAHGGPARNRPARLGRVVQVDQSADNPSGDSQHRCGLGRL